MRGIEPVVPIYSDPDRPVRRLTRGANGSAFDDAPVTKPLPITAGEDDAELDEEESSSPSPAQKSPVGDAGNDAGPDDDDRWAGTMARELPAPVAVAPERPAPRRPRISVAEASGRVPAELRDYLKSVFKCEIDKVRPYVPSMPAKQDAPVPSEVVAEELLPGDSSGDE